MENIRCNICGKEYSYAAYLTGKFGQHLKKVHNMSSKEYYDLFFKQENEGVCLMCGKPTKFGGIKHGYAKFCSTKCSANNDVVKDKHKQTYRERYGVDSYYQSEEFIRKSMTTKLKNRPEDPTNRAKNKQTCLQKYGVENVSQIQEVKIKKEETFIRNGGIKNNFGNPVILEKAKSSNKTQECKQKREQTNLARYGVKYLMQDKSILANAIPKMIKSINETKRKNGTFNTSNLEDRIYNLLKQLYDDIIRNYKSDKYPFNCDFYIPSLDLYVECNFHWTHGKHWYDSSDKNDIETLQKWQEKSKTSKFYKNAIYTWTIRDINKKAIVEENNLNYVVFWNMQDAIDFLEGKI